MFCDDADPRVGSIDDFAGSRFSSAPITDTIPPSVNETLAAANGRYQITHPLHPVKSTVPVQSLTYRSNAGNRLFFTPTGHLGIPQPIGEQVGEFLIVHPAQHIDSIAGILAKLSSVRPFVQTAECMVTTTGGVAIRVSLSDFEGRTS